MRTRVWVTSLIPTGIIHSIFSSHIYPGLQILYTDKCVCMIISLLRFFTYARKYGFLPWYLRQSHTEVFRMRYVPVSISLYFYIFLLVQHHPTLRGSTETFFRHRSVSDIQPRIFMVAFKRDIAIHRSATFDLVHSVCSVYPSTGTCQNKTTHRTNSYFDGTQIDYTRYRVRTFVKASLFTAVNFQPGHINTYADNHVAKQYTAWY